MRRCAAKLVVEAGLGRQGSHAIQTTTLLASLGHGLLGQHAKPLQHAHPAAAAFPQCYSAMPEPMPLYSSGDERDAAHERRLAEMSQGSRARRASLPSAEETAARLQSHKAASCSGQASQEEPAPALDWRDVARLSRRAAISGQEMLTDSFGRVAATPACMCMLRNKYGTPMLHALKVHLPDLPLAVHAPCRCMQAQVHGFLFWPVSLDLETALLERAGACTPICASR